MSLRKSPVEKDFANLLTVAFIITCMDIKALQITSTKVVPMELNASTLDEMTAQLPQGFYTTFSTFLHGTHVLGLKSHLQRLYTPAKDLGLHPPVSEIELRAQIAELVKENLPHESRVRLILTKDSGKLFIGLQSFEPLPESVYTNGVKVITAETTRQDPRIKDTGFISASAAQRKLLGRDVFEVLLTKEGKILEGMTSNFYIIKHTANTERSSSASLVTAQRGILLGVTRKAVLRIARGQGMFIEYRLPKLRETFEEAFLTSSSRGVVPIISIDNILVGQGRVGKWTKMLSKAYQAYVGERSEKFIE